MIPCDDLCRTHPHPHRDDLCSECHPCGQDLCPEHEAELNAALDAEYGREMPGLYSRLRSEGLQGQELYDEFAAIQREVELALAGEPIPGPKLAQL